MNNEKIAIVGLGIIAPKALNKDQFWQNVLEGKNCIGEVPQDRWDWRLYYSEDHKAADKTYSKIGGFIEGFKFDSIKYKIPPQSAAQISRLQQMTIEAVRMALEDSGYDKKPFDNTRAAAVIGNAMGAMRKEMTDMRVYKFYNEDLLQKSAAFASLPTDKRAQIIADYEAGLDRDIVKITEDTMPGELSNVTAGRIANIFNFNGPNMTMDAACASSMAALDYAVLGLRAGKFDMAVAGGADEMMSAPAFVKFCKIGALSADGSYTFDERANGFVMAEAVVVYVLKRLSDAVRDGDRIYALVNSVGASSDGKGKGITAPNPKGQKMAIENAFSEVDYGPGDVDFVEAHGTATKVGDATEVGVLKEMFGPHMGGKKLGLTAVKSQIGHSKAAAGAVSVAKTALALHHKTLPPSINCVRLNPGIDTGTFQVITRAEPWNKNGVRRANVSSFGFGGTNFHVTMEEYTGPSHPKYTKASAAIETPSASVEVTENPRAPFAGLQGEAVTFTGGTPAEVIQSAQKEAAAVFSKWPEAYPLAQYAQPSMTKAKGPWGVSIVAKSPKDLQEKIEFMAKNGKPETWAEPPLQFKLKGVYTFKTGVNQAKVGLLFPGQGSQYVDMMRDLAAKYQVVQATFDEADVILDKMIGIRLTEAIWSKPGEGKEELAKREAAIKQTQLTQPSMMTADIAMYRLLREFGVKPDMTIGHSLGEYAAATAAGIFTFENGLRAVTSRAKEMASVKVPDPGKMASVALGCDKVDAELKKIGGYVICANKNCPLQTVIAGEAKAVEAAVQHFKQMGVEAGEIAVSHAFHSEIVAPAMGPYRKFLQNIPIKAADTKILSNVTADFFPTDTQGIYDMLIKQMTSPVEFIKQLERMYAEGVRTFIECGPKRVLSAFATATLKDRPDVTVLASNHPKRGGITELNDLFANMTALGIPVNWDGKVPQRGGKFFNPYYQNWALKTTGQITVSAPAAAGPASTLPADKAAFAEHYGFNFNQIAVSGIAGGTPGTWDKLFRERNLDEILAGKNMIEPIPGQWREQQIAKNIIRVVKSPTGGGSIEKIDSVDQAIKLSARAGQLDIEQEFGLPPTVVKALHSVFKMAIGAGVLALKDAGLPLVHYYKKTTTGGYLPDKWGLPEPLASETGVIFASAFPVIEPMIKEITGYFNHKYAGRTAGQLWEVYHRIVDKLPSEADKAGLRAWLQQEFAGHQPGEGKDPYSFSQNFLLKVIPIADSQFAQWVGAKGPTIHLSAACASTTQAVHVAESWIRAGKCKRVVVIAADDITNETIQEWTMPGFLASGTATTKENVSEAALPFDRRRHGLIVGSGAVAMVLEDETLTRGRGMKPLARLLLSEAANSAFHATRLDVNHVASILSGFLGKIEKLYGLRREEMAPYTMFMSHETYTPARGGSASAEVRALKTAFGPAAEKVIVSNVKGFTGHTMGAALEDAIAVRALNTGVVPPIANYKEPDPDLAGINLSKGGKYDFRYALRFAAGFGSHMGLSMTERVWQEGESRYEDQGRYSAWVREVSGDPAAELEVVHNTLRVKDKKAAGRPAAAPAAPAKEPVAVAAAPAPRPAPAAAAPQHYAEPKAVPAHKPEPAAGVSEDSVKEAILGMITEKTGYPREMLELDLDMEADLGIDTVKQAELFAAIREHYSIPRKENISLKDYPTIRHCIKFVLNEKGGSSAVAAPAAAGNAMPHSVPVPHAPAPAAQTAPKAAPAAGGVSEDAVRETILAMITEKTGYPKDMLELDLDMEADLGIDTVKQAELFAAIREHYSIPRKENISLKDYPTIRHCIKFVLNEKGGSPAVAATAPAAAPAPAPEAAPAPAAAPAAGVADEESVKTQILDMIAEKTGYPKDMLELDLDMEADLGIDTVKQAELFAAMREFYNIPRKENLSLKDYPTIRHCVRFVLEESGSPQAAAPAPAPAAVPAPAPEAAPAQAAAPAAGGVDEESAKTQILDMIAEKTGYPKDMLELDLDMEADLGIDTVKQAELFAAMREFYNIPRKENLSLKDYPTIRHCIRFVLEEKGAAAPAGQPASRPARQEEPVTAQQPSLPPAQPAARPSGADEEDVKANILTMIAEKTGYPKDMLELDLDMEADLGIDTVKQAELFAAMREFYNIPRKENLSLKDYPTIRHCIKFVMEEKVQASPAAPAPAEAQAPAPAAAPAPKKQARPEQPELLDLAAQPAEEAPAPKPAARQEYPKRHIRHVPVIVPAPVEQEIIKKVFPKRPVAIFAEDLDLAKAFRAELNKHRADSYVFTPARTKLKDAITVDFKDIAALEKALKDFAAEHPDTQGVIYLPGCMVKSLSKDTDAFGDLKRYALPLFLAAKHLSGGLKAAEPGHTTFMAVVTTLDGGFGYRTKDAYDPVYGAIHGQTLCIRKELEHSAVKLLDFEPSSSNQLIVQKTFYELLYSDRRLAIGYADGKRWTLHGKPQALDKSRLATELAGRNVLVTGAGRGLGAMFSRMLAEQHKANILIIDIMEIGERARRLTGMSEAELKAWKMGELWNELKNGPEKATPALLEKEFTRLKDAADMHRNMEAIRALGVNVTYYRCDLTDRQALEDTMAAIKADFGQIDGVVHFAGLERSKLVVDKAVEEFNLIFNVKADSAVNIWKSGVVKEKGFWAMASSIAGKFGNLGQSDYAAANDYVAKFCVSQQNRGVRAVSIDMTGYAQIGMGARPGVEAFLKSQDMEFLYPEEGMQAFVDEIAYGKVPEIILSGSLGKLDWDRQLQYEPNFSQSASTGFHFVPKVADMLKGEMLAAGKEFSLASDPYLADHAINGTPYVPGVMGLETFAEAAAVVAGKPPRALTEVRFAVPIKLLRNKPADVRIKAEADGESVAMRLESDFVSPKGQRLGQPRTHFKAVAAPDAASAWTPEMYPKLPKPGKYKTEAAVIYKTYFHGPSFQVLDGILALDKNSVLAVFRRPQAPLWKQGSQKLVFHPLVFEALFQACGWRDIQFDRTMALPDAIGAAVAYDHEPLDPEKLFLYGLFKGRTEDNRSLYDAWAFDEDYNLVAELRGYAMIPTPI